MISIEGIKIRKDIEILRKKYGMSINEMAKEMKVNEATLRQFFLSGLIKHKKRITLSLKNYVKIREGLVRIQNSINDAEDYKGFDGSWVKNGKYLYD